MHPSLIYVAWFGFAAFMAGSLYKVLRLGIAARKQPPPPRPSLPQALAVAHWLEPVTTGLKNQPLFTVVSIVFHACLWLTPLISMGHRVMLRAYWGVSWFAVPDFVTQVMTIAVLGAGTYLMLRRLAIEEVRRVSTWREYGVVLVAIAPFATALIARHQWLPYNVMISLHVVFASTLLAALPFMRFGHILGFFAARLAAARNPVMSATAVRSF